MSDEDDDHAPAHGVALNLRREREEDDLVPRETPRGPQAIAAVPAHDLERVVAGYLLRNEVEGIPDAVLPRRGNIARDGPAAGDSDADPLSGNLRSPAASRSTHTLPISLRHSDFAATIATFSLPVPHFSPPDVAA